MAEDTKAAEVKADDKKADEKPAPKKAATQKSTTEVGEETAASVEDFNAQNGQAPDDSRSVELEGETVDPENDSLSTITKGSDRTNDGYAPQPVAPPVGTTREELAEGTEWLLPSHLREPVQGKSLRF